MLSPTPPGHWISIALQVLDAEDADLATRADVLARLGIALADSFVACWHAKFEFDLVRPVTYIRRVIDPAWEPLLNHAALSRVSERATAPSRRPRPRC